MSYEYGTLVKINGDETAEPFKIINASSMSGIRWVLERDTVFICETLRKDNAFMNKYLSKYMKGKTIPTHISPYMFLDEIFGCISELGKRQYFIGCVVDYLRDNYNVESASDVREALCRIYILTNAGITDGINRFTINQGTINLGYLIIHLFSDVMASREFSILSKRIYKEGSLTTYGDLFDGIMKREISVLSHLFAFRKEDKDAISKLMSIELNGKSV